MAVKLSESQLPQLLLWLQPYLPTTFKLYDDLKTHLQGKFPYVDFFVDRWPDPQAVSAAVNSAGHKLEGKKFFQNINLGMFAVNEKALTNLLQDKRLVDWSKTATLSAVPDSLWPVVMALIEEKKVGPVQPEPALLLKATRQDLKQIPVPEGMKISPVTEDVVDVVNSTWKFSNDGSDLYICDLVRHHPSVFLTMEDGQHVGHMLGNSNGSMGMLYIQPHFRRKGYAKVIVSQLAAKFFEEGRDVYVMIEEDNEKSINLHHSVGFKTVPNSKVAWMITAP
ncbi:glycine N-acyltransferase-like protein 3 [Littorina saxatilis]|uniref:Glycine N-acyltransferase-like protein n=1 Tax=Littorina saxatilis TaxID=31220 RepID=A0AAN9GBQ8_9CAEN